MNIGELHRDRERHLYPTVADHVSQQLAHARAAPGHLFKAQDGNEKELLALRCAQQADIAQRWQAEYIKAQEKLNKFQSRAKEAGQSHA